MNTQTIKVLFLIGFSITCLRSEDSQSMVSILDMIARRFSVSFTIEFLGQKDSPQECWRSISISKQAIPKDQDILEWNIQRLESSLPGWIVVPSATKAVFHCIDRQLLLRSPMDESLLKISYAGSASDLFVLPNFPYPTIRLPQMFSVNSGLGAGCNISLNDFSGRIRESITVSTKDYIDAKRLVPSIQWIAECRDDNGLIKSSLVFPLGRLKPKDIRSDSNGK